MSLGLGLVPQTLCLLFDARISGDSEAARAVSLLRTQVLSVSLVRVVFDL